MSSNITMQPTFETQMRRENLPHATRYYHYFYSVDPVRSTPGKE
ncbi:unnamed protein product [Haemonchus placei]|uniref:NTF2 domain-containing protein n=1 Tax=Haemonchus placei TaxID=6290 RepID=A0A0N4W3X7_HAEPC|nr:unnamed protein product [Haemonchus placei]